MHVGENTSCREENVDRGWEAVGKVSLVPGRNS